MTTDEWKNDKWLPTQRSAGDVEKFQSGDAWYVCPFDAGRGTQRLAFDPTPAEARAALHMPNNADTDGEPYTREAVHTHIREHGTVEECEAITPGRFDCSGCARDVTDPDDRGRLAESGAKRVWHTDCLNRVRSRTEAARSGEQEWPEWPEWVRREHAEVPPGWHARITVQQALRDEASVDITTPCGFTVQGFAIREDGSSVHCMRWCVGYVARSRDLPDPYAPAPAQPVEPRPFKSGDRVRNGSLVGVVTGTDYADRGYEVHVDWEDGQAFWCAPKCLTLVTPAPEEPACDEVFVPDGHATPAGVVTRAGIVNDVFGVYVRPDRPRPYDEGGTNPAGFPVMPEPPVCSECGYPAERDGMCMTHYEEAVRERSEVDQGPRVGDLVSWIAATATAGPHTVTDERRGIVVPHDDDGKRAPEGYVMARSKGTDGNAWTTVAVEACTVVRRKEEL